MTRRNAWAIVAAVMLAAIFVAALLQAIDYPFGVAWDERIKMRGAMTGRYYYYYHPLVMIDLAQGVGFLLQAETIESFIDIGRVLSVMAGGLLIFGTFMLARLVLPDLPALAAAAATAATPVVTVHARIFKEDIFLAAFLVLAFAALIRLLQSPAPHRAILLGVFAGLTAGSKYVGFLFLLFAVFAIIFVQTPGPPRKPLRLATVSGVAIGTFLLVMLPAIRRIERWHKHVNFEIRHAVEGHDVSLPLRLTSGLFHLRESLLPGLGAPLLMAGIIGLAAPLVAARERRMPLALIASFAVLWYVVHEITPLKPYPDFSRYMVPLAPLLAILAASFVYEILSRWDRLGLVAAAAILLAALPALWTSVRINTPDIDPRDVVPQLLLDSGARVAFDRYANYSFTNGILGGKARHLAENADIVLTANLTYDRAYNYAVLLKSGPGDCRWLLSGVGRQAASRHLQRAADHGLFQPRASRHPHGRIGRTFAQDRKVDQRRRSKFRGPLGRGNSSTLDFGKAQIQCVAKTPSERSLPTFADRAFMR